MIKRLIKRAILVLQVWGHALIPIPLVRMAMKMLHIDFIFLQEDRLTDFSVCRYRYGAKAAFCVSIDFDAIRPYQARLNPEGTYSVLELSHKLNIPMTWLICGSTALEEPDAFNCILNSNRIQDIGVHTFSHIDLKECSREEAEVELKKCIEVVKAAGRPVSFAFPWNRENHFDLLNELGFVAYRSADRLLGYPSKEKELWRIPPGYYLSENSLKALGLLKSFISSCLSYGCVFHLWTHPWTLVPDGRPELICTVLEPFLIYAAEMRDKGHLWICTMRELANYCEARRNCFLVERYADHNGVHYVVACSINDRRFDLPPILTLRLKVNNSSDLKVRVDGTPLSMNRNCFTSDQDGSTWLFLTISFEKPLRNIHVSNS